MLQPLGSENETADERFVKQCNHALFGGSPLSTEDRSRLVQFATAGLRVPALRAALQEVIDCSQCSGCMATAHRALGDEQ